MARIVIDYILVRYSTRIRIILTRDNLILNSCVAAISSCIGNLKTELNPTKSKCSYLHARNHAYLCRHEEEDTPRTAVPIGDKKHDCYSQAAVTWSLFLPPSTFQPTSTPPRREPNRRTCQNLDGTWREVLLLPRRQPVIHCSRRLGLHVSEH
jgi:hypothetical protein